MRREVITLDVCIVVDDASTPPIREEVLVPLHGAGAPPTVTREERSGLIQARLHAIRRTSGGWMLFVDDDNELSDEFVAEGLAARRR